MKFVKLEFVDVYQVSPLVQPGVHLQQYQLSVETCKINFLFFMLIFKFFKPLKISLKFMFTPP